ERGERDATQPEEDAGQYHTRPRNRGKRYDEHFRQVEEYHRRDQPRRHQQPNDELKEARVDTQPRDQPNANLVPNGPGQNNHGRIVEEVGHYGKDHPDDYSEYPTTDSRQEATAEQLLDGLGCHQEPGEQAQ